MNETSTDLMREFKKATGYSVPIRPFERILKYVVTDDRVAVQLETFRYTETRYEFRFTGRGRRLLSYTGPTPESLTVWDEAFEPFVIRKTGHVKTERESLAQVAFERDCYRPGTSRAPLDNYARVQAGPSTDKMERYW